MMFYPLLGALLISTALLQGCASRPNTPQTPPPPTTPVMSAETPLPAAGVNRFKHKVAIARPTLPGNSPTPSEPQMTATSLAKTLLEAQLREHGAFMVIDHGLLQIPFEIDNLRVVNDETLGADYLVSGKLLRQELVMPGLLDGWKDAPVAHAHISLQLDILDGHTGNIIFTRQFDGNASTAAKALSLEQQQALRQQAMTHAIANATPEITNALQQRRWRGQILSTQQGFVLVNGGAGQGIQVGDVFRVAPRSTLSAAPTAPKDVSPFVATLRVVAQAGENENELSVCELVEGTLPEGLDGLSVLDVP